MSHNDISYLTKSYPIFPHCIKSSCSHFKIEINTSKGGTHLHLRRGPGQGLGLNQELVLGIGQ